MILFLFPPANLEYSFLDYTRGSDYAKWLCPMEGLCQVKSENVQQHNRFLHWNRQAGVCVLYPMHDWSCCCTILTQGKHSPLIPSNAAAVPLCLLRSVPTIFGSTNTSNPRTCSGCQETGIGFSTSARILSPPPAVTCPPQVLPAFSPPSPQTSSDFGNSPVPRARSSVGRPAQLHVPTSSSLWAVQTYLTDMPYLWHPWAGTRHFLHIRIAPENLFCPYSMHLPQLSKLVS